ncbi:type II toxin-antitoxin system RelE/ParE family toxin [Sinorhizobium meliloti]|uniref:type II toxin-antitoxin system RelE/ParE family toxin n=1 Tax=Rhizobium meliloti TaxID=382 RepID=UPI001F43797B|nr:type II toxin-antitoxin system RelE/ParE family toxin [Sinorhizobium meliloti]
MIRMLQSATRLLRLAQGNPGDVSPVGEVSVNCAFITAHRVYFQKRGELIILLLCAGDKGTQDRDIGTAKEIAAQWSDIDV